MPSLRSTTQLPRRTPLSLSLGSLGDFRAFTLNPVMDESSTEHSLFQRIVDGGPIIMLLYLLIVGVTVAVLVLRVSSYRRGIAPSPLLISLSFAPVVFASFGAALCFYSAHYVLTSDMFGLTGPEGAVHAIGGGRLILYAGWLFTAFTLLSLYVPRRTNVA